MRARVLCWEGCEIVKRVGVVVLNYNCSSLTERCCEALLDVRDEHRRIEVIVVDNCSADSDLRNLRDVTSRIGVILLESKSNGGYSAGNNIGIKHLLKMGYEFVLIANPDVIISRTAVGKMVSALEQDEDALFAGPRIVGVDGSIDRRAQVFKRWGYYATFFSKYPLSKIKLTGLDSRYYRTGRDFSVDAPVFTVSGCCVLFKASFFRDCGFLDEAYFMYNEEVTWGLKAQTYRQGGHGLYVASAEAIHDHPKSSGAASAFTVTQRMKSNLIYCTKYLRCSRAQKLLLLSYYKLSYCYLSKSNDSFIEHRSAFIAAQKEALSYCEVEECV